MKKDVDLELPEYETQTVVECYLEPGKPFHLLLTKSKGYFDPIQLDPNEALEELLVQGALVTITVDGVEYPLENRLSYNPITNYFSNYSSNSLVPEDYDNSYNLNITTQDGEVITSSNDLLPVVPIDSIVVEFKEPGDTLARVLSYMTDDPDEKNYYRRVLHYNSFDSLEQDFYPTDDFNDNNILVFGTGFGYVAGDTVINTFYHIDVRYHEFLTSASNAFQANGNPFGQPSTLKSNVEGNRNPIGIFACLSYDRVYTIIPN